MNNAIVITDIRSALASVVKGYQPSRRARFRNLAPFTEEIRQLRSRGASFETIAEILKKHSITTSHETVRRFYRETIEQKPVGRKRRRKRTKQIEIPDSKVREKHPDSTKGNGQAPAKSTPGRTERGPRIARIEDL